MAKAAKAVAAKSEGRLAGCLVNGSSIGNIYKALRDGKPHKIASLQSCLTSKKINLHRRIRILGLRGLESKQWTVVVEGDTVRLVVGKPGPGAHLPRFRQPKADKPAAKPKAHAKTAKSKPAAKPKAAKPTETKAARVQDVPVDDE